MLIKTYLSLLQAMIGSGGIEAFRDAAEQEVFYHANLIPAGKQSVRRLDTTPPDGGVNAMIAEMPLTKKWSMIPLFLRIMDSMARCAELMKDTLFPKAGIADEALMATLKSIAQGQGASDIGFVKISRDKIFVDYMIPYDTAIIFTMEMDKADIIPSHDALEEVLTTYAALGDIAIALTNHIRDAGYGAYPGFPICGMVDYVRLAEQAGLEAHSLLMSPDDSTRQRINIVYTNLELPEANRHQ